MNRCLTDLEMALLAEGAADGGLRARAGAHLDRCPACRRVLQDLEDIRRVGRAGRLPRVTGAEAGDAARRLAGLGGGGGGRHRRADERLAAFFSGMIDADQAARLLLDRTVLAGAEGGPGLSSARDMADTLCALRCEAVILRGAGMEVDEAELLREAAAAGWFVPGSGTPMRHLGRLLEARGLRVERYLHAHAGVLRHALGAGYQLLAVVDAGELAARGVLARWLERMEDLVQRIPDHCVLVRGVEEEAGRTMVDLVDPAGTGQCRRVPLGDFLEAWDDSDFFLLAARRAPVEETGKGG